jgi:hypothetical protein
VPWGRRLARYNWRFICCRGELSTVDGFWRLLKNLGGDHARPECTLSLRFIRLSQWAIT